MNSRRMPSWSLYECDASLSECSFDDGRAPDDRMAPQLLIEVVGEEGRMEESFRRQYDLVLVDRSGEQGDHDRT